MSLSGLRFDFYPASRVRSLDAIRRHQAPRSEIKDVIAHIPANNGSMFAFVSSPPLPSPVEVIQRVQMDACTHRGFYGGRTVASENSGFRASSKPAVCPGGRLPHTSGLLAASTTLRNSLGEEWSGSCIWLHLTV